MSTTNAFQQLRPCIAPGEHKFAANLIRVVVCERCGMTPKEAGRG